MKKYSCIGVFKHTYDNPDIVTKYEERVVVTEAETAEEAEKLFLTEFREYAVDGIEFLNEYEINEIFEEKDSPVTEVACSMKTYTGTPEQYISRFWYDQKPVSCDDMGWNHVWHNRGGGFSVCYNCQEEREGELWKNA